ncbi:MAG TPA: alginate lyase family protein [Nitrospira sp.]|nr:alginate lyase family protein [Nitrospira sp.]
MTPMTGRLRKIAGMSPAEWHERSRQLLLKSGERFFGINQGEMTDAAFRRRLVSPFDRASIETVAEDVLEVMRGLDLSRRPFMPLFGARELTVSLFRRRFPAECERLLRRADRAIAGRFDLLGLSDLWFGQPIDWHLEPLAEKRTGNAHWSVIRYLNPEVAGDKKITWELNRHAHFVTLGQAYLVTKDDRYAEAFIQQLSGWLDANPPRRGINWASALELSIRCIAWLWALPCFAWSGRLTPTIIWRVLKSLVQQGSYIESYLSYYFAPNTHLTGEALGLLYLGTALPWVTGASRWRALGEKILLEQLPRQVQRDGVYFEHASYYHRYTTDFYIHAMLLARATRLALSSEVHESLARLLEHLLWITRPDGKSTLYGDDDGGRLLTLHQREADDFRDTLQIGATLCEAGSWKWVAGPAGPEVLWLLGPEGLEAYDRLAPVEPTQVVRRFRASGFVVMRDGWKAQSSYVFVDAGSHGAMNYVHAHADALSFEYASDGVTWIVDPGTYTYTKDKALRDQFRSSAAHNTLVVEGQSQSQPNGPFSWTQVAETSLREVTATAEAATCMGEHNGYERLNPPVRHRRSIQLVKRPDRLSGSYLLIEDRVATSGTYQYQLRFHLAPDCKLAHDAGRLLVHHANGPQLAVGIWMIDQRRVGTALPIGIEDGWVSPEYARRVPAPVLVADANAAGDQSFVTVLAPVEGEAPLDLERLARLSTAEAVQHAA